MADSRAITAESNNLRQVILLSASSHPSPVLPSPLCTGNIPNLIPSHLTATVSMSPSSAASATSDITSAAMAALRCERWRAEQSEEQEGGREGENGAKQRPVLLLVPLLVLLPVPGAVAA